VHNYSIKVYDPLRNQLGSVLPGPRQFATNQLSINANEPCHGLTLRLREFTCQGRVHCFEGLDLPIKLLLGKLL
jgi:hypothetical protein